MNITPVNDPPTVPNGPYFGVIGDQEIYTGILAYTDPDGDTVTATITSAPTLGSISLQNGTGPQFTYTPTTVASSTSVSFGYRVADATTQSASTTGYFTVDPTPVPVVAPNGLVTNSSAINFTITFNTDVTGFTTSDLQVTNGTAGTLTGTGKNYFVTITPTSDGPVTLTVPYNCCTTPNGAKNFQGTATVTSDRTGPSIAISPNGGTTSANPIAITVTLSESSSDFTAASLQVTNGTKGAFSGSGTSYSLSITPISDGDVVITSSANTFHDSAGNGNTAFSATITSDRTGPTIAISPDATSVNSSPVDVVFTFSENVTGFTASDVVVTNGTKGTFSGSANVYHLAVIPTAEGSVGISVAAGACTDLYNNQSAAKSVTFTYDSTVPTLLITPTATATNSGLITFTFAFSESVIGFTSGDVSVSNGTKGTFSGSGATYTLQVTPTAQGTVSVTVGAGSATDAAGNSNTAQTASVTYDTVAPTVTFSPSGSVVAGSPVTCTFTFSEAVTGFTASDVLVTNGTTGVLSGSGASYSMPITPSSDGLVTVAIGAGACADSAGNAIANASTTWTSDRTGPTLAITPNGTSSNQSPITFTFAFNESVTGFTASDITVTNATKGALTGSGASYSMDITPSSEGVVTVSVAASACTDSVGNQNSAASASVTYSNTNPSLIITPNNAFFNSAAVTATFTFSTSVTGFTTSDITVTNATKGAFSGSGSTYTLVLTPTTEGPITISVPDAAATDMAANPTLGANATITYDVTAPDLTISPNGTSTNANPIVFTFTFTEPVINFTSSDVSVTNGTKGLFSGSGASYSLVVNPSSDGAVLVSVAANSCTDRGGNGNTTASVSVTSDRTLPSVAITPSGTTTSADPITFTLTFSESVTGLSASSITVSNGTKGTFAGAGNVYTIEVAPTVDGVVGISLPANAAVDAVGNGSTAGAATVTSDRTGPSLDITPSVNNFSSGQVTFTFTFSEPVTGFNASDVTTNGIKGTFSGSGSTYTLAITPTAEGLVTCAVTAGACTDTSGNANLAGSASANYDTTNPTVSISPTATSLNTNLIEYTITFSEPVIGFTNSDVAITGATKTAFSGSGMVFTVKATPTADGVVTCTIADGSCSDLAGNQVIGTNSSITIDRTAPTVTISPNGITSNAATVNFTFTFSELVTGFTASDVVITNGVAGALTGSGTSYTMGVTPTAEGLVTVSVPAGSFTDAVGITNSSASTSIVHDTVGPTPTITSAASITNANPINFTITFNESVSGLQASDFIATNGNVGTLSGSGTTYALQVAPQSDGPVTLTLGAGGCADAAGNGNSQGSLTVTSDRTAPTLTISPNGAATSASTVSFTFTFSEAVSGLDLTKFGTSNAAKVGISGSGTVWTVDVAPINDGTFSIQLLSNAAFDAAGNAVAAQSATGIYDTAAPIAVLGSSSPTNLTQVPVSITFNETVTGLTVADFSVTGGTKGALTGSGASYSLIVNPNADGQVTVDLAAAAVTDAAGNPNAAVSYSFVSDRTPPTLAITPNGGSSNANQITFTLTFSEEVTGFSAGKVSVSNGSKGSFSGSAGVYSLTVFPTADGVVSVSVADNACTDLAGNGNIQASASVTSDRTPPTPTITPSGTATNTSPIVFAITFQESVTGFTLSDLSVTNGTLGSLSGSGGSYSVNVTPTTEGAVTLTLASGAVTDAVGNTNAQVTSTVTYDATPPTLAITPNGTITTANPITFTFAFSEPVTGFDASDITISNATKGAFSGSGSVYTLLVTPTADGTVTAAVGVSACNDLAGNGNQFASATVTSDRSAPTVTITPNTGSNVSPINFQLTFSEVVTGLAANDFSISNGTIGTISGSGLSYTVPVTPTTEGTVTITLLAGAVTDGVGNPNAATTVSCVYDITPPTLTINPNSGVTNATPINFTFTFSEVVTGFTASDITVTNGTAGAFSGSGTTYTLAVAPTSDGQVTVAVPSFSVFDAGGNTNSAAAASITSDRTGPSATITPNGTSIPTSPITFTITFNEPVFGFTQSDLQVTNATLSNFSGSGTAFTVNATPTVEGPVTLTLPANTCSDAQGNLNSVRTATVTYDLPSDPILYLQGGTITYQRGDPGIILDTTLAVTDPDNPASFDTGTVTVQLTAGGDSNDQLSIATGDVNGYHVALSGQTVRLSAILSPGVYGPETIIGTWTGGNSGSSLVVTFNRNASPDRVDALLRSITYSANSLIGDHNTVSKTIGISFTDGTIGTNPATGSMLVSVISPNRSPVALNTVATTLEDTQISGSLSTSWTDVDSQASAITYEAMGSPVHGTLTSLNSATGAYTFVPEANYNGTATLPVPRP
ncbi:MAG: Ig-like domain-containing protein [Paludibaculum sp.]